MFLRWNNFIGYDLKILQYVLIYCNGKALLK